MRKTAVYPDLKTFLSLSKKHNLIPVYAEINADLDTPVSAFLKISDGKYSFLLESVEGKEKIARYSFLGSRPRMIFSAKGRSMTIHYPGIKKVNRYVSDSMALDEIRKIMKDFRAARIKGLPRFYGGLVGYIGYDMVRFFEKIPDKNPDELKLPDSIFMMTDTLLAFDHVNHTVKIISNAIVKDKDDSVSKKTRIFNESVKKIEDLRRTFQKNIKPRQAPKKNLSLLGAISSNLTKRQFCDIVRKAKGYIKRGDIIQVVLSQRFKTRIKSDTFDIYRSLRSLNPSPYMYFLKAGKLDIIGASPEMLVRCEEGIAETRPIAGTRPRGTSERQDTRLRRELLADPKEKAEHLMLVDLGRNDLGRVCDKGTVRVSEFMRVEKFSHVMHIVSDVCGRVSKRNDVYDVLRACFPAGTVSGSPKIRAMEIIDELENVRRSLYAGCVGYFSFSHNMDTCITIRTILVKDKIAYVQAGGGIVADSVPEKEYAESVNKAKALFEAIRSV